MSLRCVLFGEEKQKRLKELGWIPKSLDAELSDCCIFGGVNEERKLQAIAIYTIFSVEQKTMRLEYVYVRKPLRSQGLGTEMLRLAEENLQEIGYRRVCCEIAGTEARMNQLHNYLKKVGFVEKGEKGHLLVCPQGHFQGSSLEKIHTANLSIMKNIVQLADYNDCRLKKLLSKKETTGFYIEKKDYRPELCRFYMEEGEIRGAACLRYRKDGSVVSMRGYLSPNLKYKNAMTLLITELIADVGKILKPGTYLYIKIYRDNFYESALKFFGKAEEELQVQEYQREMGGYKIG